jgi:PKD repeat protein
VVKMVCGDAVPAFQGEVRPTRCRPAHRLTRQLAVAAVGLLMLLLAGTARAAAPTGTFSFSPQVPLVGAPVTFTAADLTDPDGDAITVTWDFGDGTTGGGTSVQHAYLTRGPKTVTMTVVDSSSEFTVVTHSLRVNAPPIARFVYAALDKFPGQDSRNPYVGERVAFSGRGASGSTDPDGTVAKYEWDFNGDGVFNDVAPAPSLITTLTTPGDVPVSLKVTDDDGATNTVTIPIHVDQSPVASFTFSPQVPKTGQPVQFTSTSSDPDGNQDILSQNWDLNGDGKFDDASGPSVLAAFLTPGNYKVALEVTDQTRVVAIQTQTVAVAVAAAGAGSAPLPLTFGSSGQPMVIVARPADAASTASAASLLPTRGLSVLGGIRVSIAGSVAGNATRITKLIVTAPSGALVRAACRGPGCPAKSVRSRAKNGLVRLRKFERTVRAGAQIGVSITKPGFIGKYVLFTIRQGKAPARSVLCVAPGARRAGRCPTS